MEQNKFITLVMIIIVIITVTLVTYKCTKPASTQEQIQELVAGTSQYVDAYVNKPSDNIN